MTQREVLIPTSDGTLDAALLAPDSAGAWPAVIMFPDAAGRRPTFQAMAQRLADVGYAVLLPNPYYRHGPYDPFLEAVLREPDALARLMTMARSVTHEDATRDTDAVLSFLPTQPEVAGTTVGAVGYCMGGSLSLNAAGRFPDRVAAAASIHGGEIASTAPDSPHRLAPAMTARLYVAGAENDATFDDVQFARLSAALREADVDHELVTYPARHGFAVPDNPTYDESAAARHWRALESLFGSALTPAEPDRRPPERPSSASG